MGYATVIVASNDEAHDIKKNGERFVNDLHHAMCSGDGADTVGATVHRLSTRTSFRLSWLAGTPR